MQLRSPRWLRRIIAVFRWNAQDVEMDEEMGFHIDAMAREYVRAGMSEADATRAARMRFGNARRHKEAGHDVRSAHLDQLSDDVKSGVRQLVNARAFAFVAIVTLALGIGVNAAVFTVVKSALLDALPYSESERLVRIYGGAANNASQTRGPLSAGTIDDIGARQQSFQSLAGFTDIAFDAVYGSDTGPQITTITWVEPQFFDVLGVSMMRGRTFLRDDAVNGLVPLSGGALGQDTGGPVILSHQAWTRLFATDANVIGRELRINGIPRTIVGVLPEGFIGPMGPVDFYLAFDRGPVVANPIAARRSQWLGLIGRLKPGISQDAATREVERIWAQLMREYPADNGTLHTNAMPLPDAMLGNTRAPLLVLMASAALVLLITCANLAATMLSRALSRRKEFAMRTALGAGRVRLVRQLLTESTVMALTGGAAGVLLAILGLDAIRDLASRALPAYANPTLDSGALLVTTAIAVGAGLLFGIAPAIAIGRTDIQSTLRDETRGSSDSPQSRRLRGTLVAAQLALCVSLLVGTGLLTRSLWAMTGASLGFEPERVLTGIIQLPVRDYTTPESRFQFRQQFEERVRALSGVESVATATSVPTVIRQRSGVTLEGAPSGQAQPFVLATVVSDDYFRTLHIPLRQGRTFDAQERVDSPRTIVISESMAKRFWPNGNAVGSRLRMGPDPKSPLLEVIGIVGDVRNDLARADAEPIAYASTRQLPVPLVTFLVRTTGDPLSLVRPIERELAVLDRGLPLQQVRTLPTVLGAGVAGRRLPVLLMTGFGALALLLASVGVYSLFASMTAAREREFGVRLALGSRPSAIAALVLRQGVVWIAAGLAVGAVGIVVVVRLVGNLLYGVSPFDPITVGVSVAILVVCATIALLVPLRRATRVDAAVALRAQ
ncbi:MAG TPA: ABC transporter permease [Vicinamibacterales bacterium]|jgi:predicted permease